MTYVDRRIVDNRVFLIGLIRLYREAIKPHERGELLECARRVARELRLAPADWPIEGYYAEDEGLREYFLLMRGLQNAGGSVRSSVEALPEFQRLLAVASSPLYGQPEYGNGLLPTGSDPLTLALRETFPDWTVPTLTALARTKAVENDDFSLVGLAARLNDPVILANSRESVVLYARMVIGAASNPPKPEYVWMVDDELARQAAKFVDTFNALFGERLPPPDAAHAADYWKRWDDMKLLGRCVRLGWDDSVIPYRHYHWGICRDEQGEMAVQGFWSAEIWTTERYRSVLGYKWRPPDL